MDTIANSHTTVWPLVIHIHIFPVVPSQKREIFANFSPKEPEGTVERTEDRFKVKVVPVTIGRKRSIIIYAVWKRRRQRGTMVKWLTIIKRGAAINQY